MLLCHAGIPFAIQSFAELYFTCLEQPTAFSYSESLQMTQKAADMQKVEIKQYWCVDRNKINGRNEWPDTWNFMGLMM